MAESKEFVTLPDGRAIESLRVVDLKQQLKKYGLSNNGTKSQLVERLRAQIYLEELKQAPVHEGVPNQDIVDDESVGSNSFIQQYLKQQQEQMNQRHARGAAAEVAEAKAEPIHEAEAEPIPETKAEPIPEGLANQVEELNESLSRSQSEETDKDSEETANNGESVADKEAEAAPEEPSPTNRSSRRARRQSSHQEEEPEMESETRRTRRRTSSRGRDQEEEKKEENEEVKAPEEVEPMQTINEKEKKVQPEAPQDEASKMDEPSAPKENNKEKVTSSEAKAESRDEVKPAKDMVLPDQASSKQTEQTKAVQDQPTDNKEDTAKKESETREQRDKPPPSEKESKDQEAEPKLSGAASEDTAKPVQVAPEKEAGNDEADKPAESKEDQQSDSKPFSSQKRVKLNRSTNLSRARGSEKTPEEEKKSEETPVEKTEKSEETKPEVTPKEDVPTNKNEDKDESSAPEVIEKSPRKRITPPDDDDDDRAQAETTSKRQKTELDEEEAGKGPEEGSQPVTSHGEDGPAASEEKPVTMTMGTDERKDAASTETPVTPETEDGEIKEEGEAMEAEQVVEDNKEKESDPVPSKVEQRSRSRSFTSVSAPVKTKRHSFSSKDKPKENDQEEDVSDAAVTAPQVKKRRWGSTKTTADLAMKTNVNISTQLLKDIIPEIKVPTSDMALDLEPEEGEEEAMDVGEVVVVVGESKKEEEEEKPVPMEDEESPQGPSKRKFIRHTITAPGAPKDLQEEESDIDYEEDDDAVTRKVQPRDQDGEGDDGEKEDKEDDGESDSGSSDEEDKEEEEGEEKEENGGEKEEEDGEKPEKKKKKKKEEAPKDEVKEEKQPEVKVVKKVIHLKRAVRTVIDEPIRQTNRDVSPSKRPTSKIVHVLNLVRPFTLRQLKELLGRYGTLSAEGFWINNIKSHCYATFESSDEAVACRDALHGTTWPSSNPKTLRVEFADINELQRHMGVVAKKEEVKAEPAQEPEPRRATGAARRERILHQDRERDLEQERHTKERDRERERSRKEREWDRGKERSRSPAERRRRPRSQERKDRHEEVKKEVDEPPAKLLDDLFRKTKATPCIYWLPLTEEQALERAKNKAQLAGKREEMRRTAQEERFRDGGRDIKPRGDILRRERERERPRARERSWSREKRSRSRSRGSRGSRGRRR